MEKGQEKREREEKERGREKRENKPGGTKTRVREDEAKRNNKKKRPQIG